MGVATDEAWLTNKSSAPNMLCVQNIKDGGCTIFSNILKSQKSANDEVLIADAQGYPGLAFR